MTDIAVPVIEVRGVSRRYGHVVALDAVDLRVPRGTLVALLGPNGAGKSTLVDIISTVTQPDEGSVRVDGRDAIADPVAARRRVGVVFQDPTLDTRLSVTENLTLHCAAWAVPRRVRAERIAEALALAGLSDRADAPASALSSGLRRRLEIARALLHRPAVLVLDEPTVGLDAATRAALWAHVAALRAKQDVTVLVTTHYLAEVEAADLAVFIAEGRIVAEGTPAALRAAHGRTVLRIEPVDAEAREALKSRFPGAVEVERALTIQFDDENDAELIVRDFRHRSRSIWLERTSLESAFLRLTGETA